MNILNKIYDCLNDNGIDIDEDGNFIEFDSLSYISCIVSIEEEFQIEFPDQYLNSQEMTNINMIEKIIKELICD